MHERREAVHREPPEVHDGEAPNVLGFIPQHHLRAIRGDIVWTPNECQVLQLWSLEVKGGEGAVYISPVRLAFGCYPHQLAHGLSIFGTNIFEPRGAVTGCQHLQRTAPVSSCEECGCRAGAKVADGLPELRKTECNGTPVLTDTSQAEQVRSTDVLVLPANVSRTDEGMTSAEDGLRAVDDANMSRKVCWACRIDKDESEEFSGQAVCTSTCVGGSLDEEETIPEHFTDLVCLGDVLDYF